MARSARSSRLESRTARLKLPVAKKPTFVRIAPGVSLGYRRNASAGVWVVRVADGKGGNWTKAIGVADDFEDAAAGRALTFWTAQQKARELAHGGRDSSGDAQKLATVSDALEAYKIDLTARGADPYNATRGALHLPATLANRTVALLTAKELRHWRDGLLKNGLAPPTVKRICRAVKAAFTLAASHDPRISNANAWRVGLASLPDADAVNNVILTEAQVLAVINAAYAIDYDLGLLVEVAAVTGARPSQLARLQVGDLQGDHVAPRLAMPSSKKGRGQRRVTRCPVPITPSLAAKLRSNRAIEEPLLTSGGQPWRPSLHRRKLRNAIRDAGLDASVTIYSLRHSNIVRQLLAAVPIRVVAANHDTSVVMIERNYSKYITTHTDLLTRRALLDPAAAIDSNVVPLVR
jgi:integrase